MVAAGLGFGVIAVLVLFMWITSPYPDNDPDGALRLAGALWLLAHGADLLRPDTLTGAAVPIGLTPLLMLALPVCLVHRAAAHAVAPADDAAPGDGDAGGALGPVATAGWLAGGYLLVAVGILVAARHGVLRPVPLSALLNVPFVAVAAAVCGAWSGCGWHPVRPSAAVRRALTRIALPYGGVAVAVRGAVVGAVALVVGGGLLAGGSLAWHGHAAVDAFTGLTGSYPGRFALLLLVLALLPNAAVWAAAYALGPGFALGTGSSITSAGVHGYPAVLPDFPLLAALPGPAGRGGPVPLPWLLAVVPVAAGVALALYVTRIAVERRWTAGRTTTVTLVASVAHGIVVAVVAAFAGGPMGTGTLASFGPNGAHAGAAAAVWAAAVGLPVTLVARWWGAREPDTGAVVPAPASAADSVADLPRQHA